MSFASDMRRFAQSVGVSAEEANTAILFKLNELVVKRTPVDTGRARGAWTASKGVPSTETGSSNDRNGNSTIDRANSIASTAYGTVYYLTNNVRYITVLEYGGYPEGETAKTKGGFSKQAPAGMVRISVEELKEFVRGYSV